MKKTHAKIYRPTAANLRRLAAALRRGELVAIPTETVYGLAANALDGRACQRIFAAKQRPAYDPLIVHVLDLRQAAKLAELTPQAIALAQRFWPGPLTRVLKKKKNVPDIVTAGRDTVALRSPIHPLARKLLRLTGLPLAAPSANPFAYLSPTTAEHVREGLGRRIKHILDGGACRIGVESTIVSLRNPTKPRILRLGAISPEEISRALNCGVSVAKQKPTPRTRSSALGALAPGMLDKHYSPATRLVLVRSLSDGVIQRAPKNTAFIHFMRGMGVKIRGNIFCLSRNGVATEAARNLYSVLRRADRGGFAQLYIEHAPHSLGSLAMAINDRLTRAAAK